MCANFEINIFSTGPIPISECLRIPELLGLPPVPGVCSSYPGDWTFSSPLRENLTLGEIWDAASRGEIAQIYPLTNGNSGLFAYCEGEKYAVEIWLSTTLIPELDGDYIGAQGYYNSLSGFFMDNPAFGHCVTAMGTEMMLSGSPCHISCYTVIRMLFPRGVKAPEAAYLTSPVKVSIKSAELTEPERQWLETILSCDFPQRDGIVRQLRNSELERDYPGGYLSINFHVGESEAPVDTVRVPVSFLASHGPYTAGPPYPKDFLLHIVNGYVNELEGYDVSGDSISPELQTDGMWQEFTFA